MPKQRVTIGAVELRSLLYGKTIIIGNYEVALEDIGYQYIQSILDQAVLRYIQNCNVQAAMANKQPPNKS